MYAQVDRTDAEIERDRIVTSDEYQAGLDFGYQLALAIHGIKEGN